MALLRNSMITAAALAAAITASSAQAEDYAVNYMSRSDSITIGLGNAPTSNIIIQHPTPWPSYVNNTNIPTPAGQGISALENMMQRYMTAQPATNPTDVNAATSAMSGAGAASGSN